MSSPPPTLLDRENRGAGFGAMDAVNGVGDVIASADGAGAGVDAGEREPPPAEPLLRPLAPERIWTILDHMQRTSLVSAKARLSELVDAAEHRGQRILILRHGKPAAAIVPVAVAERTRKLRPMTETEASAFLDEIAASAPGSTMSSEEALGRGRLED